MRQCVALAHGGTALRSCGGRPLMRRVAPADVAGSRRRRQAAQPAVAPADKKAAQRNAVITAAEKKAAQRNAGVDPLSTYRPPSREGASLRAEAEAPFRSLRLVLFGAGAASALLATLFGLPALIAALAGAPGATKSALEALQDLAINLGGLAFCGFFVQRDLAAQEKQLARLMREEELGACQLELANGRVLRLAQLRSFARGVLIAGTPAQVAAALAAAEPYKKQLQERGVLVLPLAFGGGAADALPPPGPDDLRWRATPIRLDDWRAWFEAQARLAGKTLDEGLYVSLRLDGRVRGSGRGAPPWAVMAAQLPPTEGFFGGFLDGMDGKVGGG